ncbi:nitroreductase family protein [Salisaeta longa]|uniref:nitroreductase family protein n=1 Tax=Salisaeta longa TaxID=503170 RepID=UPI00040E3D94|nr:nitroreductase family protein [Salisaeta longa]
MATDTTATPDVKRADTHHSIDAPFRNRFSPRAFADRVVPAETLREVLEAARWTMSSYNEQPWRYIIARRDGDAAHYEAVLSCLNSFNQAWAQTAPVLLLGLVRTTFAKNGRSNPHARHDLGAASAALTLQATMRGLYVHQMAGIEPDVIHETFDLPEDVEPVTGLALGYLGDPEQLPEKMQAGETAPRSRKTLADFVFGATWGTAAPLVQQ